MKGMRGTIVIFGLLVFLMFVCIPVLEPYVGDVPLHHLFPAWTQYGTSWKFSYPSISLWLQNQNLFQNRYQSQSGQAIFPAVQSSSSFSIPYWHLTQNWYTPFHQNRPAFNTSGHAFSSIEHMLVPQYYGYPPYPLIGQKTYYQQQASAQGPPRLKTKSIDLSGTSGTHTFTRFYTLDALNIPLQAPQYDLPLQTDEISNFINFYVKIPLSGDESLLLEKNGFAVIENPFNPQEDDIIAAYSMLREKRVPIFITSDSLLHLFHIQFSKALMRIEEEEFYDAIWQISKALLDDSIEKYEQTSGDVQEASKRNVAYLSVGLSLLQPREDQLCDEGCNDPASAGMYFREDDLARYDFVIPDFVEADVNQELQLIEGHEGPDASPLFSYLEDYSHYVPHGHYTQSERMKNYYKAFTWYGRMGMLLKGTDSILPGRTDPYNKNAHISSYDARIQTMQACLIAHAFIHNQELKEKWERIYSITAFHLGLSDDLGLYEYLEGMNAVFGGGFEPNDLTEETIMEIKAKLAEYISPKIFGGTGTCELPPPFRQEEADECLDRTDGFRLMGERFSPDSYLFSCLVGPHTGVYTGGRDWNDVFTCVRSSDGGLIRGYPQGLDLMALLGSTRAQGIMAELDENDYAGYAGQFKMLEDELSEFSAADWNKTLSWSWLFSLKPLLKEFGSGYPPFMQTGAWQDKELSTVLASWAELRHDTIPYAKQGDTMIEEPQVQEQPVLGYVEPVPEFYNRLLSLTRMITQGLDEIAALDDASKDRLLCLENILVRLITLAEKELRNEELTQADYEFIEDFDTSLNSIIDDVDEKSKRTTLITDVYTNDMTGDVLEEGCGFVRLMIAAYKVPDGRILIGAGPVMSYYEFTQPMNNRLTDSGWRNKLYFNPVEAPEWTSSFGVVDDIDPDRIPHIRGSWIGSWTACEIAPDDDVLITDSGDITLNITKQTSTGGKLEGEATITGWDVPEYPSWTGENDEVWLSGWIDRYAKLLYLHYFNFTGPELLNDLSNLICDYTWNFDNLRIYENSIRGRFRIRGTGNYDKSGIFILRRWMPQ